uniref:Transmembrane protein 107 n=1 Tax=Panagrellus redivivus TaxID=6233 RepID=A0A7E4ZYJ8_PANRE
MADVMTPVFLAVMAHGTMIFCALFDRQEYIMASLPPSFTEDEEAIEDFDASICVCLGLSLVFIVGEVIALFRQVPPRSVSLATFFTHNIACLILLKFTVDIHPVSHFWILFAFTSFPTALAQVIILVKSFNKVKYC